MCDLLDLNEPDCDVDNLGGLTKDAYIIAVADIDETSLPTIDTDGVTLVGNIVPKSGRRFYQLYHTPGKGKLEDNSVGERDGKSFENMVEVFHPGSSKDSAAFKKKVQNAACLLIIQDANGRNRAVGISVLNANVSLGLPAYAESLSGTTGTATADANGSTMSWKAESNAPALFYEGVVNTTPTP